MTFLILVVDDKPENIGVIKDLIDAADVGETQILEATNAHHAKEILSTSAIDLLVVDISLPERADQNPAPAGGIRLLEEVFRRQKYTRPRYVIGITEREEADSTIDAYFEKNLWYLLYSKRGSDVWKTRFSNFFEKIVEANLVAKSPKYEFDAFAIGSKPDVELLALKDLPLEWSPALPLDDSQFFRETTLRVGNEQFRIGIGSPPRQGLVSATMYSATIIEKLRPRLLGMVGICAGIKGQCALGDVVFAEESWEWQAGKYASSGEPFHSEPYQLAVPAYLTARVRELATDTALLARIHSEWRGAKPAAPPLIHCGPIASGSAVVADEDMVERIKGQHRKLVGIDMEIYGMYYAAAHASMPKPSYFALKSASDFADADKGDSLQAYCAYVSSRVLLEFFNRYLAGVVSLAGRI